jgi:gluconokinase
VTGLPAAALVVMGVAGSGKTTIGAPLAQALGGRFVDGDDLHPPANRAKMASGTPLTDADRAPWLDAVGAELARPPAPVVVACSALRRAYRDRIRAAAGRPVVFLHLDGTRELVGSRMAARKGHFMPLSLLDSQFATLEPPGPDEAHVRLDLALPPDRIVAAALAVLARDGAPG